MGPGRVLVLGQRREWFRQPVDGGLEWEGRQASPFERGDGGFLESLSVSRSRRCFSVSLVAGCLGAVGHFVGKERCMAGPG